MISIKKTDPLQTFAENTPRSQMLGGSWLALQTTSSFTACPYPAIYWKFLKILLVPLTHLTPRALRYTESAL